MPTNIHDDELLRFSDRLKGQTVVITGGARGIGRAAVLEMARKGANIVIGDLDSAGASAVVAEVIDLGANAVSKACNVLEHKDQVELFELALSTFGRVDIVIPCAGLANGAGITDIRLGEDGLPKKPYMKVVEVNLIAVTYTTQLAYFYLTKNRKADSLKSLVIVASMGAFLGIPGAPLYAASKHGLIGMMRSLRPEFALSKIRIVAVCPWFVDTPLLTPTFKFLLTGIPLAPLQRVVGALMLAATDPDFESSGSAYTVPDDREVYKIEHLQFDSGVYKQLGDRIYKLQSFGHNVKTFIAFTRIFLRSAPVRLVLGTVVGFVAYRVASVRGLI